MKKGFILGFALLVFLIPKALAFPIISNVSIVPPNAWIGENVALSLNCYDEGYNITKVYGKIVSPITTNEIEFVKLSNNFYSYNLSSQVLPSPNSFNFSIFCENGKNETNSTWLVFNISKPEINLDSVKTPVYLGEAGEVRVIVKKDGNFLNEGVSFDLKLGGQRWDKISYFDPATHRWIISFYIPQTQGSYDLELEVKLQLPGYTPRTETFKSSIEVKDALEFNVLSIDKKEVKPGDTVTVSLSAVEKGENVVILKDYLNFQVGDKTVEKDKVTVSSSGSRFDAKIQMPDLSPGNYDFKITFNYKNYSVVKTEKIGYVLPVSGRFIDLNGKGINAEIRFLVDGKEVKRLTTDSSGSYSGEIVPGAYDLEINFPRVSLYLYGVTINEFDDPINYYSLSKDTEEMKVEGLYVFEVALPYSRARISINYDESKVPNENKLVVYKCSDWNSAFYVCNSKWTEQIATIDTIRNLVTIETPTLSAYALGIRKALFLDFSSDKTIFSLNDIVEINGIVRDESGNFVPNVLINVTVPSTDIKLSTFSDSSGVFTFQFVAPQQEGFYFLSIKAEKDPYIPANKTWNFQVAKERAISIVAPDTVRIKKGEEQTIGFSVINIGQADIYNLSFYLKGLPEDCFSMQKSAEKIKPGEEIKVPITFKIPLNFSANTYSLTFGVISEGITKEKIFGLTVFEENMTQAQQSSGFNFPTASIVLPFSLQEVTYLLIFAVASFSVAYFLKRMKKRKVKGREEIKNLLFDIKREIQRKRIESPMQAFNELVEKEKKD